MGGLIDTNEHTVDRSMRRHAKGHGDMATRLGTTVIGNWPGHRQIGSYDDVLDREHTGTGVHPPALAGFNLGHAGVFEDPAACCFDRLCKADEVLRGMVVSMDRRNTLS
jgi:hypothetical protein